MKVFDADKENGANEHVEVNNGREGGKKYLDGPWPAFNEKEMLVNLRDRCPCCLEVYQVIISYSESVFFDIQAYE